MLDPNALAVSPEVKNSREAMLRVIRNEAEIFADVNYQFRFPPSLFPDVAENEERKMFQPRNIVVEQEDTFGHKLTPEQINQISERGEFEVPSKLANAKVPHVWKISDWLVRGSVNRRKVWQDGLATCCSIMTESLFHFLR